MDGLNGKNLAQLAESADRTAEFLKTLANQNRLTILRQLSQGECSVSALEAFLGIRQPILSPQLAVLREENLVATRRNGKTIYYSLASPEACRVIGLLYELFCPTGNHSSRRKATKELPGPNRPRYRPGRRSATPKPAARLPG